MNLPEKTKERSPRRAFLQSVKVVAAITFLFTVIVGVLLIVNYVRLKSSDPIGREIVDSLVLRLQENPNDEVLKGQIRQMDLLARKAYFSSQWQLRTGAFLFAGGTMVFVLCVFLINRFSRKPHLPDSTTKRAAGDYWEIQSQQRWMLGFCGLMLFIFGIYGVLLPKLERSAVLSKALSTTVDQASVPVEVLDSSLIWPSFRGLGGNAIAGVKEAPFDWDLASGKGIKWRVDIPKQGMNSPVVWGDKIFLSGADESSQEIYCYDLNDGSLLWTHTVGAIPGSEKMERFYADTGGAAPSLAVDGRYVCAVFADGNLVCTNSSGEKIWANSLGIPENHYGHSSSLIIHKGLVFVQWDQSDNPRLVAYHLNDGSIAWQVERYALSWSSPICVDTGRGYELILTDSESITSYDPYSGSLNWRKGDLSGGEMGPSAFYRNGVVYAGTDMAQMVALKLNPDSEPDLLWEFDEHLPDTASMVGTDQYIFMATSYGVLACVDAKEGSLLWEYEANDGFYSSPILVGDLVYAWDMEGTVYIFSADGTFNQVAEISMSERVVSTPAFVGRNIIIRGEQNLYCIEQGLIQGEGIK